MDFLDWNWASGLDWFFYTVICFLFLQLEGISKRQSYGDVRGQNFFRA